jgi:hypothetical protein
LEATPLLLEALLEALLLELLLEALLLELLLEASCCLGRCWWQLVQLHGRALLVKVVSCTQQHATRRSLPQQQTKSDVVCEAGSQSPTGCFVRTAAAPTPWRHPRRAPTSTQLQELGGILYDQPYAPVQSPLRLCGCEAVNVPH